MWDHGVMILTLFMPCWVAFYKKNIILSNPIPTKIVITKLFVKSFLFIHDQVSFIYIIHIKKADGADIPKSLKPILVF
jgi:hypothetical protein